MLLALDVLFHHHPPGKEVVVSRVLGHPFVRGGLALCLALVALIELDPVAAMVTNTCLALAALAIMFAEGRSNRSMIAAVASSLLIALMTISWLALVRAIG